MYYSNQSVVTYSDYAGGINVSSAPEQIGDNQLQTGLNVEYEYATKALKTVDGLRALWTSDVEPETGWYDKINNVNLFSNGQNLYKTDLSGAKVLLGTLTGTLLPQYHTWDNGTIIASGGKLQFTDGTTLTTLESPDGCHSVSDSEGRIIAGVADGIIWSNVGDMHGWTVTTVASDAKEAVKIGYKDGGHVVGIAFLSSDIVIFKDNRRTFRLTGSYPNWVVKNISRNMPCLGRFAMVSNVNDLFVLDNEGLQRIDTVQDYGDIKGSLISSDVSSLLKGLNSDCRMWHVYPKNQLWIDLGGTDQKVLVYHYLLGCFTMRQFYGHVKDVWCFGDDVYIAKGNKILKLDPAIFTDDGQMMYFDVKGKRQISVNDFLIHKVTSSIRPSRYINADLYFGALRIPFPPHPYFRKCYGNTEKLYHNHRKLWDYSLPATIEWSASEKLYDNHKLLYQNKVKLMSPGISVRRSKQNVYRTKALEPRLVGSGGQFLLNHILIEYSEVK